MKKQIIFFLFITIYFSATVYAGEKEFNLKMVSNNDTTEIIIMAKDLKAGTFTYGFNYVDSEGNEKEIIPKEYEYLTIIADEYTYNLKSFNPEDLPMPFPFYDNDRKVFLEEVLIGYYSIYYIDLNLNSTNTLRNIGKSPTKDDGSMNPYYNKTPPGPTSIFLFSCESDENYQIGVLRNMKFYDNKAIKECPEAMAIAKEEKMFIAEVNSENYQKISKYYNKIYGAINENCSK